jgi:hypothetical protein
VDPEIGLLVKSSLGMPARMGALRKPLKYREGPRPKESVQGIAIWNPHL